LDGRIDDHELPGHPPGLAEKLLALGRLEMAVEVAGEDPLERAVLERELERVAANVRRVGRLTAGLVEHRIALVEADDLSGEVPGQESGAAGDVERSCCRERLERAAQGVDLVVPAWTLPVGEAAGAAIPLVVLRRTSVVVRLHRS